MQRDKERTLKKITDAVGRLLEHSDLGNLGINAVAREAGIDKVLIYRYFGGIEELLRTFSQEIEIWPSVGDLLGAEINLRRATNTEEVIITLLRNILKEIRLRKTTQEIMRWELIQKNALTEHLANSREKQGELILGSLPIDSSKYTNIDLGATVALLQAGISYLVLHSKTADKYVGIDLHSNYGWNRIGTAIESLVKGYMAMNLKGI